MTATATITRDEWAMRRRQLADKMPPNSIALLPSAKQKMRNGDAEYPFRQDSDFYYLTGFSEPQAFFVLQKNTDNTHQFMLFCDVLSPDQEKWIGKKIGIREAVVDFGANEAYPISELDVQMPALLAGKEVFFYSLGLCATWDTRILGWVKKYLD